MLSPITDPRLYAIARFLHSATPAELFEAFGLITACGCWHCAGIVKLDPPFAVWLHSLHVILYPPAITDVTIFENVCLIHKQSVSSLN